MRLTRSLSAAHTPSTTPMTTAIAVATSTCEKVSIASGHSPRKPISANISAVVIAGRRPLSTYAIAISPASVMSQGVSTRNVSSGWSMCATRKFPIGFVMSRKRKVVGFWT